MGPVAAGFGHSVTSQTADDPAVSSSASRNDRQCGRVFDGWAESSDDWQRAGDHPSASRLQVPDICVSAISSDAVLSAQFIRLIHGRRSC